MDATKSERCGKIILLGVTMIFYLDLNSVQIVAANEYFIQKQQIVQL